MDARLSRRAGYRIWQFLQALAAPLVPLDTEAQAEARSKLPEAAWGLFLAMSPADQRHSLNVMRTLRDAGYDHPALLQAALLHDCAKHGDGIRLWHRVAIVLLKTFMPARVAGWQSRAAPSRGDWRYSFWAHLNHPRRGAELAEAAGCGSLAAALIRRHQDPSAGVPSDTLEDRLMVVLQAADEDN